ncbi:MAG TPA: hypothetical protein VG538_17380 [Vicinamibacterales bacterium]|nr:hypothetical protein [Vicinamibacterales bacterium]
MNVRLSAIGAAVAFVVSAAWAQHWIGDGIAPVVVTAAVVAAALSVVLAARMSTTASALAATGTIVAGSTLAWDLVRHPEAAPFVAMSAGAIVAVAWMRAHGTNAPRRWMLTGLAGGTVWLASWPAPLVLLLPVASFVWQVVRRPRNPDDRRIALSFVVVLVLASAAAGGVRSLVTHVRIVDVFLPRGAMTWSSGPSLVDVLWSSAGGLLATSPAIYVAVIGLACLWRRQRLVSASGLALLLAIAWTTPFDAPATGFPADRFAVAMPFFVCGLAALFSIAVRALAARPCATAVAALAPLVLWNATMIAVARRGGFGIGEAIVFSDVAGDQARVLHGWLGHPGSWPANLAFAAANRMGPARFDLLYAGRFFSRRDEASARIDVGSDDDSYVGDGWHARESDGTRTFRWARSRVDLLVPMARAMDAVVRVDLQPFPAPGRVQTLTLRVNGQSVAAPTAIAPGWQRTDITVPATRWRAGVNRLVLEFAYEARPSDVNGSSDARPLAAAVDAVTIIPAAAQ